MEKFMRSIVRYTSEVQLQASYLNRGKYFDMRFVTTITLVLLLQSVRVIAKRNGYKRIHRCEHEMDNLKSLVERIVEEIAVRTNCIVFITDTVYSKLSDTRVNGIFLFLSKYNIAIRDNEDFSRPRKLITKTLQHAKRAGCNAYIILIANGLLASRLLQYAEGERIIDTRGYFLLMYDNRLFRPELHYIWNRIVNVVFLQRYNMYKYRSGEQVTMERIDLSTVYYPSRKRNFTAIKYIDTWYDGKLRYGNDHYVSKATNLHGNGLRVAVFEHIPAVTEAARDYYHQKNSTETLKALGIEFELIRIVAKTMNFKANYYTPYNIANDRWGKVGDNDSYTGFLGEAVAGNADFFLGDLHYTLNHLYYFDLSTPYNTECLTFLTPEALTDNSWKLLILPFRLNAWIALLCTLLIGGSAFHLFALFYQKYISSRANWKTAINHKTYAYYSTSGLYLFTELQNSILYTYGMLLQVSLPCLPNAWAVRIFIGWWWIYSILVAVVYRASMTATLAHPVARVTIDTLAQLTRTSLAVGGWSEESKEFFLTSPDPYSQDIGSKFELTEDEKDAIDRVANGTFCYYENSYFLQHARGKRIFAKNDRRNKSEEDTGSTVKYNLHVMEECAIHMPIALGLEKNSPLKPHVDLWVRRMTENGLVHKWLSDVMEWSKIIETQQGSESGAALVDLRKLHGAFVALAIGYLLSYITLLGEILHWKYIVLKDPRYDKYHLDIFYKSNDKSKS